MQATFIMLGRRDALTGGYIFNYRMAEYLADSGIELDVISRDTVPEGLRDSVLRTSLHVARRVLRARPDVVIVSKSYLYMAPLRFCLAFSRIPLLYLVNHLVWRDRRDGRGSLPRRWIVRWLLGRARRILVISASTANDVENLGLPQERLRIIHPGFDRPEGPVPERDPSRSPVSLLCVGSLTPRKAQDVLVMACTHLGERTFTLDLVGDKEADPGYTEALEKQVKDLNLSDRITFHGMVDKDELASFYRKADILVHPSRWEGYGITVAEAMWLGLPVVACEAGAIPELVWYNVSGYLVPAGDHEALAGGIAELIDSPDLRRSMGTEGRRIAEQWGGWEKSTKEFLELVLETTATGGTS